MRALVLGAATVVLTYVAVGRLRQWAERHRLMDLPNERSSHTRPTPRGGGLAIAAITIVGTCAVHLGLERRPLDPGLLAYVGGATLVALVSWLDDLRSLSSTTRLAAQAFGAVVAILGLGYWTTVSVPVLGTFSLGWVGLPLTLLWLLGLTNAYNFMDGIDGIAGSQGVVAGFAWAVIGGIGGEPLVATLGLMLGATSLGFLGHNWAPARIFMGDVGSAFLGYSFACLPLLLAQRTPDLRLQRLAPALGCLVVWPFVLDAGVTFIRRAARREQLFAAHRSHIYQRLVIAGESHRRVAAVYAALAAAGALVAVTLVWRPDLSRSAIASDLAASAGRLSGEFVPDRAFRPTSTARPGARRSPTAPDLPRRAPISTGSQGTTAGMSIATHVPLDQWIPARPGSGAPDRARRHDGPSGLDADRAPEPGGGDGPRLGEREVARTVNTGLRDIMSSEVAGA